MATPRTRLHRDAADFIALIPARVAGIPCLVGVDSYTHVPHWRGSAQSCPSAADWYGYTDMTWEVLDRHGRRADWLARKLDSDTQIDIETEIERYFKDAADDARIDAWIALHED